MRQINHHVKNSLRTRRVKSIVLPA